MILRGLWKLAKGQTAGLAEFGESVEAFFASLAPLIAFPLVGALAAAVQGQWRMALIGLLSRLCAVLLLPVCVYEFARLFGHTGGWLRTATALNWSFWMLLPALLLGSFIGGISMQAGLNQDQAELLTIMLAGLYVLWFRVFLLRAGLGVSYAQAACIVLVSALAIGATIILPDLLGFSPPLPVHTP